ncbi:hypothetical protein GCM10020000_39180 [Streptomyces olivoverticillatus]
MVTIETVSLPPLAMSRRRKVFVLVGSRRMVAPLPIRVMGEVMAGVASSPLKAAV